MIDDIAPCPVCHCSGCTIDLSSKASGLSCSGASRRHRSSCRCYSESILQHVQLASHGRFALAIPARNLPFCAGVFAGRRPRWRRAGRRRDCIGPDGYAKHEPGCHTLHTSYLLWLKLRACKPLCWIVQWHPRPPASARRCTRPWTLARGVPRSTGHRRGIVCTAHE
jgi:hypothetical protein